MKLIAIARRAASRAPMEELDAASISVDTGVANDLRGKPGKRQVTLLSREAWDRTCEELGGALPWTIRRANLLVSGVEFGQADVGRMVRIGEVSLEITRETDPCPRMDEQHPGLTAALAPDFRGGVCCRVLTGGTVCIGDPVELHENSG